MTAARPASIVPACIAALSCIAVAAGVAADPDAQTGKLSLQECAIDDLLGSTASARCGYLQVPEDRDDPHSRQIDLRITVIPSLRLTPLADPFVVISGGPGQSASSLYATAGAAFAGIRRDRDILIVDQRGTGQSQPLDCQFTSDAEVAAVAPEQMRALAQQCLGKLPGDPRYYTTSVAVRDLDDVRAALGYESISLYGVSYGTRVAQHYLRRYPQRVRSMILDGVVPVGFALGPEIAQRAQEALDAIFDRCAADSGCEKAFPQVRQQFAMLRASLERAPITTSLSDPLTAQQVQSAFGPQHLGAAIRLLTYSDETASLLPLLIHEAQTTQRFDSLVAQYLMIERMIDQQFAYGMHFAVVCSEDAPRWDEMSESIATASSYLGPAFMQSLREVCAIWPRGTVDEGFHDDFRSDVPVLLLSGSNDPVTPAAYGEHALRSYPNGRHIVLEGQGHGQLATGCMPRLLAAFVRSAEAASLDTDCLESVKPAPFMLNRSASAP